MRDKKEKNILVVITTPFNIENKPRYLQSVENACKSFDNVDVVTYPVGKDIPKKNMEIHRVNFPFYNKTDPGPSISKAILNFFVLLKTFQLVLKNDYSVIQGEDVEAGVIANIVGKTLGVKTIYSLYNPFGETLKPYGLSTILVPLIIPTEFFLNNFSDVILTEWEYDKTKLKERYKHKDILHVPDLVGTVVTKPDYEVKKEYIVYSGNFKKYQGVDLLLDAFESVKKEIDLDLVLIGQPTNQIIEGINSKGLGDRVHLVGLRTKPEANYLISKASFSVMPRIKDGPPSLKGVHYLSWNKVVLATDLDCNRKLLKNGWNSILVNSKKEDFAEGIKRLVKEKNLLKNLEKNIKSDNRKDVLQNDDLDDLYRELS